MCGYFCIEFINYMLKGKTLLHVLHYHIITCAHNILLMIKIITCD